MKEVLTVTYLGKHPLHIDGVSAHEEDLIKPGETRELIEDSQIRAFIGAGPMANDDGTPAFKVKATKITKKEEEKKIEKAEKKAEKEEGGLE